MKLSADFGVQAFHDLVAGLHMCVGSGVERKLTLEQLAHDAEIDLTYLGGIERGRRNPSVDVLGRLAAVFKVHPKVLLED